LLDLIASLIVRALNIFFHIMPIRFNLWIGRRLGFFIYLLSPRGKKIAYTNLKASFYKEKTPLEIRALVRSVYKRVGETFVEMISMTKANERYIKKFVSIENPEFMKRALEHPKGAIILSAHFGNWELAAAAIKKNGYTLDLFAKDQKWWRLNELLNKLREVAGNNVIRKGMDMKGIFQVLKNGGAVAILGDQNAGVSGGLSTFLGRSASTTMGPYRFAQKSGAMILPTLIHRVSGPWHKLTFYEPMIINEEDELKPFIKKYNYLLEKAIREYPDQWLWMHKKWKMTPLRKVIILDDGDPDKLNQSIEVYQRLKTARETDGYSHDQTEMEIVRVEFRNKYASFLFNIKSPILAKFWQGRLMLLKLVLKTESYKNIVHRYADTIISCGKNMAKMNIILKRENNARNLSIGDPGTLNRKYFNLIVFPNEPLGDDKILYEKMKRVFGAEGESYSRLNSVYSSQGT